MQQATFGNFDPPKATDRLFLAIFPDETTGKLIAEQTSATMRDLGLRGDTQTPSRLHVTLFHLGDWVGLPNDVVTQAMRAMSNVTFPSFDVQLDQVEIFGRSAHDNHLVFTAATGNEALFELRSTIGTALAKEGLGKWVVGQFKPHITLAYKVKPISPQSVPPCRWQSRDVVLVHSLLGRTKHIVLGHWSLS